YVAPESRSDGRPSPQGDVYSLGAILMELLTGRRPSLDAPSTELRAGDPRSDELGGFLRRCLAVPGERFASAVEAHRALQQLVTGNPFSLFTANLALFLYKLLNPESQSVAPTSDWESTSPVVVETKTRRADSTATPTERGEAPRRRLGDLDPTEETAREAPFAEPAVPTVITAEPDPTPAPLEIQEHARELIDAEPALGTASLPWKRQALLLAAAAGVA